MIRPQPVLLEREHEQVVDVRVILHHGTVSLAAHQIDGRVGVRLPKRPQRGSGAEHVADTVHTQEQDFSRIQGRYVYHLGFSVKVIIEPSVS